jgi:flagellar biosynthesis/type III secretory pathway protein FliH
MTESERRDVVEKLLAEVSKMTKTVISQTPPRAATADPVKKKRKERTRDAQLHFRIYPEHYKKLEDKARTEEKTPEEYMIKLMCLAIGADFMEYKK